MAVAKTWKTMREYGESGTEVPAGCRGNFCRLGRHCGRAIIKMTSDIGEDCLIFGLAEPDTAY